MASSEFSDFSKLVMRHRPFHRLRDPWQAIRQFTPNWFAMTMGTGIVYLLLVASPVQLPGQVMVARILWIFDSALYLFFATMLACRMMLFAETIKPMLDHPVQSLFLGTIPMGLIPIINGTVIFGGPLFGGFAAHLAAYLWWVDALLALTIACFIPYRMFTTQKHSVEQITALWLLPVVAPEVTASSARLIAAHLDPFAAQLMIGAGYLLWAVSVPLAFSILTLVFLRLALHKLPHRDMAAASWLTLGPIGTGSLGIMSLGQAATTTFASAPFASTALMARDFGLLVGLLLWGAGLWWLIIAIILTLRYWRDGMQFNLGWWGFTFPLGVFASASLTLFHLTAFRVFEVLGLLMTVAVVCFWIIVVTKTLAGMWRGNLFHAPCLVVDESQK